VGNNRLTLSQKDVEALFLKQGLQVLEPYINSRTRIKAQCLGCGKIVEPYYRQIWSGQKGCRDCASVKFRLSDEAVTETLSALDLILMSDYRNVKIPFQARCAKCGLVSDFLMVNLRKKKTSGCIGCEPERLPSRIKRSYKKLSLNKSAFPEDISVVRNLFSELNYELIGDYMSSSKAVSVKHLLCGTVSERSLKGIKAGKGFCKGCTKNRTLTEAMALAVLDKAGFEPIGPYVNVDTPWEAKCKKCGRILSPTIHVLKGKKSGCAFCNKVRIDPQDAERLMISAGYTPLEPYKNSKARWKSRHETCGKTVFPRYNSVYNGQGGCPDCVDKYSYNEPSYFYVLENSLHNSLKIGISNNETRDDRVLIHAKHGWKLIQRIEFENGFLAYEFEQTLLRYLRKVKAVPVHLSKVEMPQSGYSETMSKDAISLAELQKLVRDNQAGFLSN
jgi:hypothetical protein